MVWVGKVFLTCLFLHVKQIESTKCTQINQISRIENGTLRDVMQGHPLHRTSGGFRNLERGVHLLAHEAHPKSFGCHTHFRSRWQSELNILKQL